MTRAALDARADRIARSGAKRAFDVAFALLGLAMTWPVWLILSVAIKIQDGGPVLFRQDRSGVGRPDVSSREVSVDGAGRRSPRSPSSRAA